MIKLKNSTLKKVFKKSNRLNFLNTKRNYLIEEFLVNSYVVINSKYTIDIEKSVSDIETNVPDVAKGTILQLINSNKEIVEKIKEDRRYGYNIKVEFEEQNEAVVDSYGNVRVKLGDHFYKLEYIQMIIDNYNYLHTNLYINPKDNNLIVVDKKNFNIIAIIICNDK